MITTIFENHIQELMTMKNLFLVFAVVAVFFACVPENNPDNPEGQEPVNNNPKELIVTGEASGIDYISVTLSGYANIPGGTTGLTFGVLLSVNENPTVDNGKIIQAKELDENNKFHCTVDNLLIGTKYYYKAYLKEGDYYRTGSKTLNFTTKDFTDESIVTGEAAKIEYNSATLNGTTDLPDSFDGSLFGIILSEEPDPTVANGKVIQAEEWDGSSSFYCKVTKLEFGTKYYYKAYFKYKGEYHTGKTQSFTTTGFMDETIATGEAKEIGYFSAKLNGTTDLPDSFDGSLFGIILSEEPDPTVANGTVFQADEWDGRSSFYCNVTGLEKATKYYYKAYFIYNGEYRMGKALSFTTKDFADDLIVTSEATEIEYFSAVLNGSVNDPSGLTGGTFGFLLSENVDPTLDNGKVIQCEKPDGNNMFSYKVPNLSINTTYYYKAYFKYKNEYRLGKAVRFTTKDYAYSTPQAIDLGLSVKWASFNLGASSPEEYGFYYAWGETEPKGEYSWNTYKWGKNTNQLIKYCMEDSCGDNGFTDGKKVLDPEDDVAHVKLGGKWRMPTGLECSELLNCTWTWVFYNDIDCWMVTGPNGNSIFLPFAGYRDGLGLSYAGSIGAYWSSALVGDKSNYAWCMNFSLNIERMNDYYRYRGLSVRPVSD